MENVAAGASDFRSPHHHTLSPPTQRPPQGSRAACHLTLPAHKTSASIPRPTASGPLPQAACCLEAPPLHQAQREAPTPFSPVKGPSQGPRERKGKVLCLRLWTGPTPFLPVVVPRFSSLPQLAIPATRHLQDRGGPWAWQLFFFFFFFFCINDVGKSA